MNPTSIMAIAPYAAGQAILGIAAQYGKDYLINKADQYEPHTPCGSLASRTTSCAHGVCSGCHGRQKPRKKG